MREQLQGPLATAAEELAAEDGSTESEQPSPAEVAAGVEAAMHKLFGATAAAMDLHIPASGRFVHVMAFEP